MLEVFLGWGNVCIQAGQWPLTSKMVWRCCLSEDKKEMWTACGDMFGLWHKKQTSLMTSYWNGQSYSQKNSKCLESKAFFSCMNFSGWCHQHQKVFLELCYCLRWLVGMTLTTTMSRSSGEQGSCGCFRWSACLGDWLSLLSQVGQAVRNAHVAKVI